MSDKPCVWPDDLIRFPATPVHRRVYVLNPVYAWEYVYPWSDAAIDADMEAAYYGQAQSRNR